MATHKIAQSDATRCTMTTEKGRRCKLEIHNDTVKHVFIDRSGEKKSLSAVLPQGFKLTATDVKQTDVLKKQVGKRGDTAPRDADQRRVDADAVKNASKNTGNTNKTSFEHLKLSEYIVPPEAKDVVLAYIKRAYGSGGPESLHGKTHSYRTANRSDGNVQIQWAIVDKTKD